MPVEFVVMNPPNKRVGQGGRNVSKVKKLVAAARPRARKFLGLSVPIVVQGVASGAGFFAANLGTAKVIQFAPQLSFLNTWWGRALLKVGIGVGLRYVVHKIPKFGPQVSNAVLAGCLAGAAHSVAKNFLPQSYETTWGLAGDAVMVDSSDILMGSGGSADTSVIESRLASAINEIGGNSSDTSTMGMYAAAA
jgi:hypothetical protein